MSTNAEILLNEARAITSSAGGPGEVDPVRLVAELRRRQPQFASKIRLLGAALALGAVERFKAGAKIEPAIASLSADLAILEAVPPSEADVGGRLAARLAGYDVSVPDFAADAGNEKADHSWFGTTDVVEDSAAAAGAAAKPGDRFAAFGAVLKEQVADMLKKKPLSAYLRDYRVLAAIVILILIIGNLSNSPSSQPQSAPPPLPPSTQPARGANALPPMLASPTGRGSLPTVQAGANSQGTYYSFGIPARDGRPLIGVLFLPNQGGWERGQFDVVRPGSSRPLAVSAPAAFTLVTTSNGAQRRLDISQWQSNETNLQDVCLIAARKGARDVPRRGFDLCVLLNRCGEMLGCVTAN